MDKLITFVGMLTDLTFIAQDYNLRKEMKLFLLDPMVFI